MSETGDQNMPYLKIVAAIKKTSGTAPSSWPAAEGEVKGIPSILIAEN
jgi:hypothetical protein